ncbi:MAG TPA: LAGLIDADG family homing endonuclease [Candidatus Bathyarchaeia archaeon]|nr:LAGLIDADG family homing endonuclease [Candidatus Bathyarchaeia archaeon]
MDTSKTEMLQWALREQERYIRGFVDGEGWPAYYRTRSTRAHHKPGYVSSRAVFISNTNKALLENIRVMLYKMGIDSKLYLDTKAGVRRSTITSWKLAILGRDNLRLFRDRIGFSDAGKAGILKSMLDSYRKHGSESLRRSLW